MPTRSIRRVLVASLIPSSFKNYTGIDHCSLAVKFVADQIAKMFIRKVQAPTNDIPCFFQITEEITEKILKHLDLWDVSPKLPPCANPPEADQRKPLSSVISTSPGPDDPPSLLFPRCYKPGFGSSATARQVTYSMFTIRLTCRGVVRRTKTETYL